MTTSSASVKGRASSDAVYVGEGSSIEFSAGSGGNSITHSYADGHALEVAAGSSAALTSTSGSNTIADNGSGSAVYMAGESGSRPTLTMTAGLTNTIKSEKEYAVHLKLADATLTAGAGNTISSGEGGLYAGENAVAVIKSTGDKAGNLIKTEDGAAGYAVLAENKGTVTVSSEAGSNLVQGGGIHLVQGGTATFTAGGSGSNEVTTSSAGVSGRASSDAVYVGEGSSIAFSADSGDNAITHSYADGHALEVASGSSATLTSASGSNTIADSGSGSAVYLAGESGSRPSLTMTAGGANTISTRKEYGLYLSSADAALSAGSGNTISGGEAAVYGEGHSKAVIEATGDKVGNTLSGSRFALYSTTGSSLTVRSASARSVLSKTASGSTPVLAATEGGAVEVDGPVEITGSENIAAASGENSTVSLNYGDGSLLEGTAAAFSQGRVTIAPQSGSLVMTGRVLGYGSDALYGLGEDSTVSAGTAELSLAGSSVFTGTADNGRVASQAGAASASGIVNVALSNSARWVVTGHSAVSTLSGSGGTVQFQHGGQSLEIGELSGAHTFVMDLSTKGSESDMLYIRKGTADKQTLVVNNAADLYGQMQPGDAVRFATVRTAGGGFGNGTVVYARSVGLSNETLSIQYRDAATDALNTASYNDAYNGDGTAKPTTALVESDYGGDGADNLYVVKTIRTDNSKGADAPSKAQTIVWRYTTDLDTFTKRRGQTVYTNPGEKMGPWVRAAYKSIGVSGAGSISGGAYEMGLSGLLANREDRTQSLGLALGWSDPSGDWDQVRGRVNVRDFDIALYHTMEFFGNGSGKAGSARDSALYWDSYLKFHRVNTSYHANDPETREDYTGKYSQNVINLSTEVGRHFPLASWLDVVPQAQLQASYLHGYSFRDSQGISVKTDGDWSVIGRIGADAVLRFNDAHDSRLHLRASLLHEFADGADVNVSAYNTAFNQVEARTTGMNQKGTWGVVGAGFTFRLGRHSSAFIDGEYGFGNDYKSYCSARAGLHVAF